MTGAFRGVAVCVLSSVVTVVAGCGPAVLGVGGPPAGGGGGVMNDPPCAMMATPSTDDDGACVTPACDELDPDQTGALGGIGPELVGGGGTGVLEQALSKNGCRGMNSSCDLDDYPIHKGGNKLHDYCADSKPQDSLGWKQGTPYGSGHDLVVGGVCFDRAHYTDPVNKTGVVLGEAKTGRLRYRRADGSRICASKQERILLGLFATLYKELPIAARCGYEYTLVLGDQEMENAIEKLKEPIQGTADNVGPTGWVHLGQPTGLATDGRWRNRFQLYAALGISKQEQDDLDPLFLAVNFKYHVECD